MTFFEQICYCTQYLLASLLKSWLIHTMSHLKKNILRFVVLFGIFMSDVLIYDVCSEFSSNRRGRLTQQTTCYFQSFPSKCRKMWWWDFENNVHLYYSLLFLYLFHHIPSVCMVMCWSLSWRDIMLLLKLLFCPLWSMYLCLYSMALWKSVLLISLFLKGFQETEV